MKLKSLLFGSAAAIAGFSTAQAADAVVVEPEPVEYVRVCDAYGSGFFYIPGTETCIRFSGFVRSSYEKTHIDTGTRITSVALPISGSTVVLTGSSDITFWGQRARLNIDTRNETDWGTLRALYRLEGGDANTDVDVDMDVALISLAGFRAGFAGANYWSTNHGFAGVNFTGLGAAYTPAIDEGWYGFNDATIFDYTWASDGFSVTIGVEDPRIDLVSGTLLATGAPGRTTGAFNSFSGGSGANANFYAGMNWSADWGGMAFTAIHDSSGIDEDDGSAGVWAYKVSIDLDLSEMIPGGILHGMYMWDEGMTNYVHNWGGLYDPGSIWQVAFQADLSDEVQLVAQYSHAEGSDIFANAFGAPNEDDAWSAAVGLNWFPAAAPGFSLRGSYKWGEANGMYIDNTRFIDQHDREWDGFFVSARRDF